MTLWNLIEDLLRIYLENPDNAKLKVIDHQDRPLNGVIVTPVNSKQVRVALTIEQQIDPTEDFNNAECHD